MKKRFFIVTATIVIGILAGIAADRILLAQQPGIKRTTLLTADDPAARTYEAIMAIAELPPGASSGKHTHYGIEIGYVMEGSLIVEHDGRQPMTLNAGDSFKNDAAHNAKNVGNKPAKMLAVYLVEKGKPLAQPVP
jgi:quercetin dioxygenase-like cupin family protein